MSTDPGDGVEHCPPNRSVEPLCSDTVQMYPVVEQDCAVGVGESPVPPKLNVRGVYWL